MKLSVSFCFSNRVSIVEHYHNSSWLEHGGSPEKAMKSAFVSAIDARLKQLVLTEEGICFHEKTMLCFHQTDDYGGWAADSGGKYRAAAAFKQAAGCTAVMQPAEKVFVKLVIMNIF